ncbi:MAG: TIGR00730 family Rossman fold protein [Bacteroidetes bacterium HGW-Bacteroidetes-6]|nr:MAG: TIGR00730 family Rossman fold protein [Bacteroidetes bacterium HGW-Bacteroidetes-6]
MTIGSSKRKAIAIFCGSSAGASSAYTDAARNLVMELKKRDYSIVYGAGCTGLMGVIADEALRVGVHITGIVPSFFMGENVVNEKIDELIVTSSMAERKTIIAERSDAFIALPGGFGTLDELFEVATAVQLGLAIKPIGLLNTLEYYNPLIAMLEKAITEKFVRADHMKAIAADNNPQQLLHKMENLEYEPPANWIEKLVEKNKF